MKSKLRWNRVVPVAGLVAVAAAADVLYSAPIGPSFAPRASTAITSVLVADTLQKGPPWCLAGVQPRKAQFILDRIRQFADAPTDDSALVEVRVAAGNMPRTAAVDVQTVTDEATCRKASRALDQWYWQTRQGAAVHLVKVGTRYAIHAPGVTRGEFEEMVHTDSKFAKLAIVLF